MLKWEFTVSGQTLTRTDRLDTYADMVGQLQASFALDTWWDDCVAIAQFVRDGIAELRVLQNGICDVPNRVLQGAGMVYISLYAVDAATRKTTNEINISIEPSGIRRDSLSPSKPSETVWQQTLDLLGGLRGGETGQVLTKISEADYDIAFLDPSLNVYKFDTDGLWRSADASYQQKPMEESMFGFISIRLKLGEYENDILIPRFNFDITDLSEITGAYYTSSNGEQKLLTIDKVLSTYPDSGIKGVENKYKIERDGDILYAKIEHLIEWEGTPSQGPIAVFVKLINNGTYGKMTKFALKIETPREKIAVER